MTTLTLTPLSTTGDSTTYYKAAGSTVWQNFLTSSDSDAAILLLGDGTFRWGAGGATDYDTNLYRSAANTLKTDDAFVIGSASGLTFSDASAITSVAYTSFTPVLKQAVTLTLSSSTASYVRIGKLVIVNFYAVISSAGTAANAITVDLPVTAANATRVGGSATYNDSGVGLYTMNIESTTTVASFVNDAAANYFGIAPGVTAASGDSFRGYITYEAA